MQGTPLAFLVLLLHFLHEFVLLGFSHFFGIFLFLIVFLPICGVAVLFVVCFVVFCCVSVCFHVDFRM